MSGGVLTFLGGGVVGALLSLAGTFVSVLSAKSARQEERAEAANVRAEERESQRAETIASARRAAAEDVLADLAALRAGFGAQTRSDYGTFSYNEVLTRQITYKARLVRDEDLQEAIRLSIEVINGTWVLEMAGELEGSGYAMQIETLETAMNIIAASLRDQGVDGAHLRGLGETKKAIDEAYADMYE